MDVCNRQTDRWTDPERMRWGLLTYNYFLPLLVMCIGRPNCTYIIGTWHAVIFFYYSWHKKLLLFSCFSLMQRSHWAVCHLAKTDQETSQWWTLFQRLRILIRGIIMTFSYTILCLYVCFSDSLVATKSIKGNLDFLVTLNCKEMHVARNLKWTYYVADRQSKCR